MFKSLAKAVVGMATVPLDVAADLITLGGAMTDKEVPYTYEKCKDVMENVSKAVDPDED